ncbi:MAG: DUF3502 domain-containing protein [Clostridia bacterium]|nr:DUF3502 domain-containing protein [Clostridia bacterium]
MKRFIALFLALLFVCTCLVGCSGGGDDESKEVELKWYVPIGQQEELKRANAYINEVLAELLPNTTLTFVQDANFSSKWSMWMASSEPIDIAYTGYMVSMINEAAADSYLELDELIDEYGPAIKAEREEFAADYETGVYAGKTYAIPNLQPILHQTRFMQIPAELYEYFPAKEFLAEANKNAKTTEKMYELITQFLKTIFDKGLANTDTIAETFDVFHMPSSLVSRGYDWIGSERTGAWLCYDAFAENPEIVSFFETEEYKLYMKYAAQWYQAGYIPKDVMVSSSGTSNRSEIFKLGKNEIRFNEISEGIKTYTDEKGNITDYVLLLDTYDQMFNGTVLFGSYATYTCLPYTCKNPERAMKLINLLKTEEGNELFNAIIYGVEGRHYTKDDSDPKDIVANGEGYIIQPDSGDLYGIPHWMVGNVYKAYRTPNILKGQKEYCYDFVTNIKPNKCFNTKYKGFQIDLTDKATDIQNISDTVTEFNDTLLYGVKGSGYQAYYDLFIKELKANGIDDIKKYAQEKANEYIKK